jgi:FkbM family methyltransferase
MNNILKLVYNLVPLPLKILLRRVRDFYQWDTYYQKSWSQEGEDLILSRYFENKKTTGFFVDVGAHHPLRFSNTYKFYKRGWHGINIDAMPGSMDLFNSLRPRDINIEKAVSDSKQILTYYGFNEPALNGFSKEITKHRDGQANNKIIFTKDIETSTLEEILDEYMPKEVAIDFMSIDVEGLDFSVLRSNDFVKYRPMVILIEIL